MIDDWEQLCHVFRLDDETGVAGVIVATTDALRVCDWEGHRRE